MSLARSDRATGFSHPSSSKAHSSSAVGVSTARPVLVAAAVTNIDHIYRSPKVRIVSGRPPRRVHTVRDSWISRFMKRFPQRQTPVRRETLIGKTQAFLRVRRFGIPRYSCTQVILSRRAASVAFTRDSRKATGTRLLPWTTSKEKPHRPAAPPRRSHARRGWGAADRF